MRFIFTLKLRTINSKNIPTIQIIHELNFQNELVMYFNVIIFFLMIKNKKGLKNILKYFTHMFLYIYHKCVLKYVTNYFLNNEMI